jgi:hypothetical protein
MNVFALAYTTARTTYVGRGPTRRAAIVDAVAKAHAANEVVAGAFFDGVDVSAEDVRIVASSAP